MQPSFDRRVLILALATFAAGTEAYVYAGLLGDMARDLGVSVGQMGLLAAGFAVTYAVAAPVLASLTARWPRDRVLTLGLTAAGLVNLAAAAAPDFGWLFASRIACGLIAAAIGPSATAAASALVPPEARGRAMAVVGAGTSLAFTLGVPLGSAIGGLFGWRSTFVFAGLLLFVCAFAIRFVLPRVPPTDAVGLATLKIGLDRTVAPRLALTALIFTATFSTVAYLGPVANAVAGARGFQIGLFQACIGFGSIIGILIGGRLADRARPTSYLPRLLLVVVLTQLGYVAAQSMEAGTVLAAVLLAGATLVGAAALFATMPIIQVGLIGAAPDRRNVVLALNGSMIFLGQGLGAALGGLVINADRLANTGFAGAAVAFVLAIGVGTLISTRALRRSSDEALEGIARPSSASQAQS